MEKSLLCLSWLNGQVKAVAGDRGSIVGTWERPTLVVDFTDFTTVLAEAVEKTRPGSVPPPIPGLISRGKLAIVLAHPRLSHQVVEVPTVKGRPLERILQRQVQRLKTFEGEGVWATQPAMPTKNSNALLLHLFPQSLVDQLAAAAQKRGLQLVRLLPTASVLASQLKQLSLQKDELALLAAETGTTTTVVIGGSDGRVCLARVLRAKWDQQRDAEKAGIRSTGELPTLRGKGEQQGDNLGVELTRTIGFAEQQSGRLVKSVWLFGPGAKAQVPALQSLLHLPVKLSPVECTPFYWAAQAAKLPEQDDGNLISREVRQAPQRRRLVTATGLILLILLMVSLAAAGFVEVIHRRWSAAIAEQDAEVIKLQKQRADWQQRREELARKEELIRIVLDEKLVPVPASFLGYVSEAVPEDLLLTELRVNRTTNAWFVKLAGAAQPPAATQPTTNSSPAVLFRDAVASTTNKLATGPFHFKISRCLIGGAGGTSPSSPGAGKGTDFTFSIEGVIP